MGNPLGKDLYAKVQESQGFAFISDDCEEMTDEEILKRAKSALCFSKRNSRILAAWIRKQEKATSKEL